MKWISLLLAGLLSACGGGGTAGEVAPTPAATGQFVGEIISSPSELASSELRSNFAYAGKLPISRAIEESGRRNILDLLFVTHTGNTSDRLNGRLPADLDNQIAAYKAANPDVLVPGVRVLLSDEVFWNPPDTRDDPELLNKQFEALQTAVAKVRSALPQVSIGITITPYATFNRPNTAEFIERAIALVDWVGTDVYWFGETATIDPLHQWSAAFPELARRANPDVEIWYIAQAFRLQDWDLATFQAYMRQELANADRYDGILFFGWQFASEISTAILGRSFDPDTKALYRKYFR